MPYATEEQMVVAHYRERLLPASETFVVQPTSTRRRYRPLYCGVERVEDGLPLPADSTFVLYDGTLAGRIRRRLFRDYQRAPTLVRAVKRERARLVHAHFGPDGLQGLQVARAAGLPLITTYYGFDATWSEETLRASTPTRRRYVEHKRELIEGAELFLTVADALRQRLLAQGFPPEKVLVHHISVDTDRLRPVASDLREDVILFVGRFVEKKGPEDFVRAAAICQRQHPEVGVVMVGDGPLRAQTAQLADELLGNCTFHGWLGRDAVHELMSRARVLCVPSKVAANGDSEGLPTVICEAAALGTPTVGYVHSGIPEVVLEGVSGLLVPEGEHGELGRRLLRIFEQRALWQKLSDNSRDRIVKHFDSAQHTARLEALYDRVRSSYR